MTRAPDKHNTALPQAGVNCMVCQGADDETSYRRQKQKGNRGIIEVVVGLEL